MNLSEQEFEILETLHIKISRTNTMNNYGDFNILESQIFNFLRSLENSDEHARAAAQIIYRIVLEDKALLGCTTVWVTLRAYNPNSEYDVPRWHTDGSFYGALDNYSYKLAYAFQGPGTLFVNVPEDVRDEFLAIQSQMFAGMALQNSNNLSKQKVEDLTIFGKMALEQLLANYDVYSPAARQGAIFLSGGRGKGAIHCEPPMHENRLFMSIVPVAGT